MSTGGYYEIDDTTDRRSQLDTIVSGVYFCVILYLPFCFLHVWLFFCSPLHGVFGHTKQKG